MQDEVSVTIKRNLKTPSDSQVTFSDHDGTQYNFHIDGIVHVQTDGRFVSFNVDVGFMEDEEQRKRFVRALSGFGVSR